MLIDSQKQFTQIVHYASIQRELNLEICGRAGCLSYLFTEWEIILFLLRMCIIMGVRNAEFESVSVLTDQICD